MVERDPDRGRATPRVSRRNVLVTTGVVGFLGSLGGCTDGTGSSGAAVVDSETVFGYRFPYLTEEVQLNPWANGYPREISTLLFESPTERTAHGDRRAGELLESIEIDGTTVRLGYSDAFTWWNGEPVTARDQWVADRIDSFVRELADADSVRSVAPTPTLVDRYTLEYELDRPLARPLVLSRYVPRVHDTPAWLFEPWLDRLETATTDDEREDVIEELQGRKLGLDEAMNEGVGCGPYELVEVSPNRLLLERFDDHPRAAELSIPTLWLPVTSDLVVDELIRDGSLDGGHGVLERDHARSPEYIEQLARYRRAGGTKLVLNWRNDHLARRNVRRALLCALPVDDVVEVAGWGEPAVAQTGLSRPLERRWLDDAFRDRLHRYPVAADRDRGAEYMRAAGYARDGGRWRGPDGNRVELVLRSPTWDDWRAAARLVEASLNEFGFDVRLRERPNPTFRAYVDAGDYDLLPWWTAGHPYGAYDAADTSPSTLGYGVTETDADRSVHGKPVSVAVPIEPGDVEAADEAREPVNVLEQWRRIRRPSGENETAEAVATLARWWNDALPDLDLATAVTGVWGNTRDFDWPTDEERYRAAGAPYFPIHRLLKTGAVAPAGSSAKK